MLAELTVKEFLDKVAGSDPVPGGGSIAALNGAVASLKDTAFVDELKREACRLEQLACMREKELLEVVNQELNQ